MDLLRLVNEAKAKRDIKKVTFSLASQCDGGLYQAFESLTNELERIEFCCKLATIWQDKESYALVEELCSDVISSKEISTFHGAPLWGMTITDRRHNKGDQQLRVWIEEPNSISKHHADSSGRLILFQIYGESSKVERYWNALTGFVGGQHIRP